MKKQLNWKEIGQLVSVLVSVFTVIRNTLKQMAVGVEILEWLIDDGKEIFVEKFLKPLGENFQQVNSTMIKVNRRTIPPYPNWVKEIVVYALLAIGIFFFIMQL